jgi:hypothetical protein
MIILRTATNSASGRCRPGKWSARREGRVNRFTLVNFFYEYLWLIVEMQSR